MTGNPDDWPKLAKEAIAIQKDLAPRIETEDRFDKIETIAGIDVAFPQSGRVTRAAIVLLSFPEMETLESTVVEEPTRFPYVPGLLSFREAPAILAALAELKVRPDLLMVDGHGLAHPRRFGIACHVGLLADLPAVGVGKSRLCGEHGEPGPDKGASTPLMHKGETIGIVLRSRSRVKPVYVSVGQRIGLETAVRITRDCATRFRLPEPTRLADRLSKAG